MTNQEFEYVFNKRIEKCKKTLVEKAKEYARGDRLSNFKKASGAMGCCPESSLVGMWMKHIISIIDLVQDIENGRVADYNLWDEKIGDAINYLILLDALITERLRTS